MQPLGWWPFARSGVRCLFLFLFFKNGLFGQKISGTVASPEGEALVFVSILLESAEGQRVVFSDIEGRFLAPYTPPLRRISFRYIGYREYTVTPDSAAWPPPDAPLHVVLQPADNALREVEIRPGENPAHRRIRRAVAQRHANNPERRSAYQCRTYNKLSVEAVPRRDVFSKQKNTTPQGTQNFDRIESDMRDRHLFLLESVTERRFRPPDQVQENVLLNRVSGFTDAGMVALANSVQPFSFYGDYLTILDKNYLNPISPGSTERYFFDLRDSLYLGTDTVWIIAFEPRRGAVFSGLKGVLHLHSRGYAVQHVSARPAVGTENMDITLEQAYAWSGDSSGTSAGWFPTQLNFEITLQNYPARYLGMHLQGHSFVTDAVLNPPLRAADFNVEQPLLLLPDAATRDSAQWAPWRALAPLSTREWRTYDWLDSVGQSRRFDLWGRAVAAFSTGVWPLGKSGYANIDLRKLLKFNDLEGTRLGLGFANAQPRPMGLARRVEWGAWAGVGLRDGYVKYGGSVLWRVHRGLATQVRLGYQRNVAEPGTSYELTSNAWLDRSTYAQRMDLDSEWSVGAQSRLWRGANLRVAVRQHELRPVGYAYAFRREADGAVWRRFEFREATVALRYAYGEVNRRLLGDPVAITQRWPVVEVAVTRGIFEKKMYARYLAALYQGVFVPRMGYLTWRLEGGMASADAPLAKLFTLNQTGGQRGLGAVVLPQTFQALPDTFFVHDRYLSAFVSQEVGPVFYQKKYSAPALTVLQSATWGDLRHPERHLDLGFRSVGGWYLESGVRLDHLLRINYVNFAHLGIGGAVFYRWGGLAAPRWSDNLVYRLALKMTI
jgi:hypothetical protein